MEKYMIEIDNVTKRYILGQIGGTTLHEELQRRRAKRRGKEDPTKKIGAKNYADGEEFWALSGVSFKVKKGERVGIIGHNGAGKSTLLKLLSRVTAPTSGEIGLDGRVTSMLEVGTGFHGELTGRENIYMNGAILGMSKAEIDKKMDDIIEFSECGQFIDTPVKRYSSGMYVKLAFSVAAHLDSEIMIMDEVLAVGDMAFQKKCLDKMNDVSRSEGRTILYVSHNMNTIRQLCDRVVVLDHGKVVFDGDVEEAISVYLGTNDIESNPKFKTYTEEQHEWCTKDLLIHKASLENDPSNIHIKDIVIFNLEYETKKPLFDLRGRIVLLDKNDNVIGMSLSEETINITGNGTCQISFSTNNISADDYKIHISFFWLNDVGIHEYVCVIHNFFNFTLIDKSEENDGMNWDNKSWGHIVLKPFGWRQSNENCNNNLDFVQ